MAADEEFELEHEALRVLPREHRVDRVPQAVGGPWQAAHAGTRCAGTPRVAISRPRATDPASASDAAAGGSPAADGDGGRVVVDERAHLLVQKSSSSSRRRGAPARRPGP